MAIDPVLPLRPLSPASLPSAPPAAGGFSDALGQLLTATDASAAGANQAISGMLQGTGDVHDAMIAIQKAEMTFELTVQVRNKLIQAYQDVMRMTI
jgi:flagellar hook-basal body complex protein FliE